MTPTVTTDSEPGSWEHHERLTERLFWAGFPGAFVPASSPACATCGGRICGCSDAQWVGASHSIHNGEVY